MLFIVSEVKLGPVVESTQDRPDQELKGALEHVPNISWDVSVARADGEKCPRCWRTVPSVSSTAETPGICDRCERALAEPAGPVAG